MTQTEILKEIKKLSTSERLAFIEATLVTIREDLKLYHKHAMQRQSQIERKRNLQAAAKALQADYAGDSELTIFTNLDGEDFHV